MNNLQREKGVIILHTN